MTLICLISGQLMPNLFSVILLKPEEVILVHTIDSKEEALFFSAFIKKQKYGVIKTTLLEVKPFNPVEIKNAALSLLNTIKSEYKDLKEFTLNYTGGTKPMSIEFVSAFNGSGVKLVYIDTQQETCWWSNDGNIKEEPLKVKLNIPEVFSLARGAILGQEQESLIGTLSGLTNYLLKKRSNQKFKSTTLGKWILACVKLQLEMTGRNKSEKMNAWKPKFNDERLIVHFDAIKSSHINVHFDGVEFIFKKKEFWLSYFTGGWFEHYVYTTLKKTGVYDDLRCNLRIKTNDPNDSKLKNEIDVVAVKNGIPIFVECKTGLVTQKSITNLKTATEIYGGRYGEAVIVALSSNIAPAILEKIEENKIQLIQGVQNIDRDLESIHEYMVIKK